MISIEQQEWWNQKAANRSISRQQAFRTVPWSEIDDFEQRLEREYGEFFLSAGPNQKARVDKIKNTLDAKLAKLTMDKSSRWRRLGITISGVLLFATLAQKAGRACENIKSHSPAQLGAWETLEDAYVLALEKAARPGSLRKGDMILLKENMINYNRALEQDDDVLNKLDIALTLAIQLSNEIPD